MKAERRDFLKAATTACVLSLASQGKAFGQDSGKASGELRAGSGTLYLEGKLKSGVLKLEAQDLLDRADRSVIVRGRWDSLDSKETTEIYSAMFSYQKDLNVFALFHDHDHSTIVVLSNSDDVKIGSAIVWNDGENPQILNFKKAEILAADKPQTIADVSGKVPDLTGRRKPPEFTSMELESVFGSDPELLAFMRGRKATHDRREDHEWACWYLSNVRGSTLGLFWTPPRVTSQSAKLRSFSNSWKRRVDRSSINKGEAFK